MLAAGMGLRMGGNIRKQYLMLGGMPMFLHSIRTMQESECITDIIVMAHRDDVDVVRGLLEEYGYTKKLRKIAVGGKERVHSVAIGLEAIDWPCDYVFIHDCARPFLNQETIYRLFETVLNVSSYTSIDDVLHIIGHLDSYELYEDINSEYDLGKYYIESVGIYDLSDMGELSSYIDYEKFGHDLSLEEGGTFTEEGYLLERKNC